MILWAVPALAAAAYYLLAIIAVVLWRKPQPDSPVLPPISILKPMYGRDERLYDALRSHAVQDYPEFEILFGIGRENEPAVADIQRLQREFPKVTLRVVPAKPDAPNAKVAVLAELARQARHDVFLINDDDIRVEPGYLRAVAAGLGDARTGLVTCLYRAHAASFPSRIEALGVATEFAPSVMVARLLGVVDFALGATMALRAETLREIGGFEAIAGFLADDYQLGHFIAGRGYRIELAPVVVETGAGDLSWQQVWKHQLRWSRTIRVSRPGGYYGSLITHATIWALVACLADQAWAGAAALGVRITAGLLVGGVILRDRTVWKWFWFLPIRDLFGFAVWVGGCFGSTVYWRGRELKLRRDGRLRAEK